MPLTCRICGKLISEHSGVEDHTPKPNIPHKENVFVPEKEVLECSDCLYWYEHSPGSNIGKCACKEHLETLVVSASRITTASTLFKHNHKCCYGMRKE